MKNHKAGVFGSSTEAQQTHKLSHSPGVFTRVKNNLQEFKLHQKKLLRCRFTSKNGGFFCDLETIIGFSGTSTEGLPRATFGSGIHPWVWSGEDLRALPASCLHPAAVRDNHGPLQASTVSGDRGTLSPLKHSSQLRPCSERCSRASRGCWARPSEKR